MRVTIDKTPDEGSDLAEFIETVLKEHPSLHFKAITTTTTPSTAQLAETQAGEPPSMTKDTAVADNAA